jgi:hypothetical protein
MVFEITFSNNTRTGHNSTKIPERKKRQPPHFFDVLEKFTLPEGYEFKHLDKNHS